MTINIKGREYALATTLRVAYMVQGMHNHAPYSEVFEKIGAMTVEDQIGILYCAFKCANPIDATTITQKIFTDYYFDNFTLKDLLDQLKELVEGIMGTSEKTSAPESNESSEVTPL